MKKDIQLGLNIFFSLNKKALIILMLINVWIEFLLNVLKSDRLHLVKLDTSEILTTESATFINEMSKKERRIKQYRFFIFWKAKNKGKAFKLQVSNNWHESRDQINYSRNLERFVSEWSSKLNKNPPRIFINKIWLVFFALVNTKSAALNNFSCFNFEKAKLKILYLTCDVQLLLIWKRLNLRMFIWLAYISV